MRLKRSDWSFRRAPCSAWPSRCPRAATTTTAATEALRPHPRRVRPYRRARRAKKGGHLTVLSDGDIDYMDPSAPVPAPTRSPRRRTGRFSAGSRPTRISRPRTSRPRAGNLRRRQDDHVTIHDGISLSPPEDREVTAADVKYAIERTTVAGRPERVRCDLRSTTSAKTRPRRRPPTTPPEARLTSRASRATDDQTLEIQLNQGRVARVLVRSLSLPVSAPVPRSTRRSSTPRTRRPTASTSPSPARTWSRTTRDGRADRLHAGQGDRAGPNPNWDTRHRLPPGVPGRDHIPGGLPDPPRRRGRSSSGSARSRRLPADTERW